MANWQRTLELADAWNNTTVDGGTITIPQLAGIIADRLAALSPFGIVDIDTARYEIIADFREMAKDPDLDVEDFDANMVRLYDWADTRLDTRWNGKAVCWVNK